MAVPQGCLTLRRGDRLIELHTHGVDGVYPGVGGLVYVENGFVEHEGLWREVHVYNPSLGDPEFQFDQNGVTVFEECIPAK